MKTAIKIGLWVAVLALVMTAVVAQQQGQQGQQQSQQPPPGQQPAQQPPAPPPQPPLNQAEEDAYKAFFNLPRTENDKIIADGEAFLKTYPESRYREAVYQKLATTYFGKNEIDKFLTYGEKALEINADNVDMLPMMALVMPRRIDPSKLGGPERLAKAEGYAKRGIELLNALAKPESLTQEDFDKAKNEKVSMCRSGLGIIYFQKQRFAEAATELEEATKIVANPDPSDLYILAVAYQQAKRFSDAVTAYERCSQLTWAWQDRCKQGHEEAKKQAATSLAPPKP
jgi:tetratricopeptide (TPR) repeat protein